VVSQRYQTPQKRFLYKFKAKSLIKDLHVRRFLRCYSMGSYMKYRGPRTRFIKPRRYQVPGTKWWVKMGARIITVRVPKRSLLYEFSWHLLRRVKGARRFIKLNKFWGLFGYKAYGVLSDNGRCFISGGLISGAKLTSAKKRNFGRFVDLFGSIVHGVGSVLVVNAFGLNLVSDIKNNVVSVSCLRASWGLHQEMRGNFGFLFFRKEFWLWRRRIRKPLLSTKFMSKFLLNLFSVRLRFSDVWPGFFIRGVFVQLYRFFYLSRSFRGVKFLMNLYIYSSIKSSQALSCFEKAMDFDALKESIQKFLVFCQAAKAVRLILALVGNVDLMFIDLDNSTTNREFFSLDWYRPRISDSMFFW
jgi:hypothetical protein